MGFMDFVRESRAATAGIIATNYSGDLSGFDSLSLFNYVSNTGIDVNEKTALEVTAVSAAVRIIAEAIAALPFNLYEKNKRGGRTIVEKHPVHTLLHDSPNPFMTANTFWETIVSHVLLWGNGYAEIEWGLDGHIKNLWLLRPDMTRPLVDVNGQLYYQTTAIDKTFNLSYNRVLHIFGLGFDGLMGYSPIRLYREAIGLAKATEKYGATYFGNGASPGGVLEHPGNLSKPAADRIRDGWAQMHSGLDNAHRIAVLEEGLTYKQVGLPPEDSQFLQTRKFQIAEISRIFRVPLHLLSELDRSTNNNIEHQGIEFLTYTINSWLVKIQQAVNLKLLLPNERKKLFSEHVVDALLKTDVKTRYESYQTARQNGWMSADDIRDKEGLNPIGPEQGGDAYLVNTAMQPIANLLKQPAAVVDPKGGDGNGKGQQANPDDPPAGS